MALHATRVAEEAAVQVRWHRTDSQILSFAGEAAQDVSLEVPDGVQKTMTEDVREWPGLTIDQISAIQNVLASHARTVEEVASLFRGARRDHVARHLETLSIMGEVRVDSDGAYHLVTTASAT